MAEATPDEAFDMGLEAARLGRPEDANPFGLDGQEALYLAWNDGWAFAGREEEWSYG